MNTFIKIYEENKKCIHTTLYSETLLLQGYDYEQEIALKSERILYDFYQRPCLSSVLDGT